MPSQAAVSPEIFFDTAFAYQRTFALKTAVDIDLFSAIGEGADSVPAIAKHCAADERGVRILCDYLAIAGLLTKAGDRYGLTPEAAAFLTKSSPTYLGTTLEYLNAPHNFTEFARLTETVRNGTVPADANAVAGYEQDHWLAFARAMVPMIMPSAMTMADLPQLATSGPARILDIAAGHGMFGLTLGQGNPSAEVVAVDWPGVLELAKENASRLGMEDRFRLLPGDAFKVDYGSGFDIALLTNFLHHYDPPTNTTLLRKVAAALKPGGRVAMLEFVPNDDRVSPPFPASFSMTMLASTPRGDAYTLAQLRAMAEDAGFENVTAHPTPTPETIVVAVKRK